MGALHRCRSLRAHRRSWRSSGARSSASTPKWPSARARWIARWSACTSRSSAKPSAASSMSPCALVTGLPFHDTQCGFKLFETSAGARSLLAASSSMASASTWKCCSSPSTSGYQIGGSSGALGQRGRHQSQHAAGLRRLHGPAESPPQRHSRQIPLGGDVQALMMTSLSRSRVRKNFTLSNCPKNFSRLRLLYSCAGRRIPCCEISSEFNWSMRNV